LEVVDFLLFLDRLQLLLDRSARAEGLGGAAEAPNLREDVLSGCDSELERIARREPELVDALDVAGIGNRDPQRPVLDRVGNGSEALEHVEGDLAAGLLLNTGQREVDQRHLVASRERARETFARRDVLLDERVGERAHAGSASDQRELVLR